mmetsp:Transcript_15522/g.52641  ORF Transcript_15522/g.52641 Transcript_15522/m.52641 type:complete len:225 (-) Transcript_15522:1199-1873(-)
MSSSWRPYSTTLPPSMNAMASHLAMVAIRWAMTSLVVPWNTSSSASPTARSFSGSRAAEGSSRSTIAGLLRSARAMLTRCRCPPDRSLPPTPALEWYPRGSAAMKSCACASRAARSTSSMVTARGACSFSPSAAVGLAAPAAGPPGSSPSGEASSAKYASSAPTPSAGGGGSAARRNPRAMFSAMVRSKMWGSWCTTAQLLRNHSSEMCRTSTPSSRMRPELGG